VNRTMDRDAGTRGRIEQHWTASESGDSETEHAIYAEDGILDYPQSGERFRGRAKIRAQRGGHPAERHFTVRRIQGGGDLWVSEVVITYDDKGAYQHPDHVHASQAAAAAVAATGTDADQAASSTMANFALWRWR